MSATFHIFQALEICAPVISRHWKCVQKFGMATKRHKEFTPLFVFFWAILKEPRWNNVRDAGTFVCSASREGASFVARCGLTARTTNTFFGGRGAP